MKTFVEFLTESRPIYNTTITSRQYDYEDGAKFIVTKTAKKGKQDKWSFTFFDVGEAHTTDSYEVEGNTWKWIDGEERADRYSRFHGEWKMKRLPTEKY